MEKFELIDEDYYAIDIAIKSIRRFLRHPNITARQVIGLGNALYALKRLPLVTPGSFSEFGLVYQKGTEESNEMQYITFKISESKFEISIGGSYYDMSVGSDSVSEPGWFIDLDGSRDTECDLSHIEDSIEEYLNLGAEIYVDDSSEIEYE